MGTLFPRRETPPVKRYSLLIAKSGLIILNLFTMGAMAGGGESRSHVLLVSPYSAGCGEYGDIPFDHGETSKWSPRTQESALGTQFPAFGLMAK
jgi:hypothetical protein